ncbi:MAG: WYL domain-containing protein [Clostridia bacterium]|nr:WYL domain-containing protein [Clostridia bacterium]
MSKSVNQKLKLMYIARYLSEKTDDNNTVSVNEIISMLEKYDVKAERKSIYDDIELLKLFGYDIERRKDKNKTGYYLASRDFELAELKILVDSIQVSKFLTEKKTNKLIRKIEELTSENEAKELQRDVFVHERVKTESENVFYTVDGLYRAINSDCAVKCKYWSYTATKTRRFRKNGEYYTLSPYALLWEDENYYLLAWDNDARKMKHFRVDKMTDVTLTKSRREGRDEYSKLDITRYQNRVFGMYGGETRSVRINFDESIAGTVIDRFGRNVVISPEKDGSYSFTAEVGVSPTFFAWVSTFGGAVRITAPDDVKEQFKKHLKAALKAHK